jgi:hypothetical protein
MKMVARLSAWCNGNFRRRGGTPTGVRRNRARPGRLSRRLAYNGGSDIFGSRMRFAMTLRATAVLGVALAAAILLTGCYYPPPQPAYTYYPPGCVPNGQPPANPPTDSSSATPAPAPPPCQLVPSYGYAYPGYAYPYYPYYPGYYAYPGYAYPPVSVGVGARFRL